MPVDEESAFSWCSDPEYLDGDGEAWPVEAAGWEYCNDGEDEGVGEAEDRDE